MPRAPKKIHLGATFTHRSKRFTGPVCGNGGDTPQMTKDTAAVTCNNCFYAIRAITDDDTYFPTRDDTQR